MVKKKKADRLTSERYRGVLIKFVKLDNSLGFEKGFVGAIAPKRSTRIIGIAKGKDKTLEEAKKSINRFRIKNFVKWEKTKKKQQEDDEP